MTASSTTRSASSVPRSASSVPRSASDVIAEVAVRHGVSMSRIYGGGGQSAPLVRARSEAALLMRRDLKYSLPQIGRILKLHHTSVLAAVRRADQTTAPAPRRPSAKELASKALRFDERLQTLEERIDALERERTDAQ